MNGCRHEQEDRKRHHPDVVKEEGCIDWCAEGPGCTRQEPDTDRIEEIKARTVAATPGPWGTSHNPIIPLLEIPYNAGFIANSREDIPFLLDEIERLEGGVTMFSDELDLAKMETIRLRDEINRLNNALDATETARKNLQEWRAEDVERLTAEVEEYHAWQQGKLGVEEYLELKAKNQNLRAENDRLQSELAKCTSGNGTYISIESHEYLLEKMRKSMIRQAEKV